MCEEAQTNPHVLKAYECLLLAKGNLGLAKLLLTEEKSILSEKDDDTSELGFILGDGDKRVLNIEVLIGSVEDWRQRFAENIGEFILPQNAISKANVQRYSWLLNDVNTAINQTLIWLREGLWFAHREVAAMTGVKAEVESE